MSTQKFLCTAAIMMVAFILACDGVVLSNQNLPRRTILDEDLRPGEITIMEIVNNGPYLEPPEIKTSVGAKKVLLGKFQTRIAQGVIADATVIIVCIKGSFEPGDIKNIDLYVNSELYTNETVPYLTNGCALFTNEYPKHQFLADSPTYTVAGDIASGLGHYGELYLDQYAMTIHGWGQHTGKIMPDRGNWPIVLSRITIE